MKRIMFLFCFLFFTSALWGQSALVLQSDFGMKDGAVAAMKGVAYGVSNELKIFDLTHEIPQFNIWEAAYRLEQTATYWPAGTVFVSVVDPGVGTDRKSVVLKTRSGHYFVTPDNGTLTLVAKSLGLSAVREIDEAVNRLQNSEESYTFHGRDVYAYTGARLASGVITFEAVGPLLPAEVVTINYQEPRFEKGAVRGAIPILDIRYGNVWTNISRDLFSKLGVEKGQKLRVKILHHKEEVVFSEAVIYVSSFGDVGKGEALIYMNSLGNVSLALNQDSFAAKHGIESGSSWEIEFRK